jgi:microcystin-dependent protein
MFGGNFAPAGWMFCDGQLLPISENETLFQLIGTTYGGDGQSTFGLPNLQSRVPIHMGTGKNGLTYQLAEVAGTEQETLSVQQIPLHNHAFLGSSAAATLTSPQNGVVGTSAQVDYLTIAQASVAMNSNAISPVGGSQPHENSQPFLCVNFIISLFGIFPSPT